MAVAEVSTAGAGAFTVDLVASMAADFTRWVGSTAADSMLAGSTVADSMLAGSTTIDFAIAGFSSVERSHIPGGVITRTMGITITANLTPRRPGTTVPILPAITLM
jgi:hypothetical protein